jgi:hypothetical protein
MIRSPTPKKIVMTIVKIFQPVVAQKLGICRRGWLPLMAVPVAARGNDVWDPGRIGFGVESTISGRSVVGGAAIEVGGDGLT